MTTLLVILIINTATGGYKDTVISMPSMEICQAKMDEFIKGVPPNRKQGYAVACMPVHPAGEVSL